MFTMVSVVNMALFPQGGATLLLLVAPSKPVIW